MIDRTEKADVSPAATMAAAAMMEEIEAVELKQ
jgi:hypothetical protein